MRINIPRLRELDFLRGVAIILVLFRHQEVFTFTRTMGWIGVDLFFVLSGFLVSGLLFKEYKKFGNFHLGRFLIRRGFKIYPIYYLTYILYITPDILQNNFSLIGILSDMTFTQNYVLGWGYAYTASWSLAVEEHFYFALALVFWFRLKSSKMKLKVPDDKSGISSFEHTIILLMTLCLTFRVFSNLYFQDAGVRNFSMSHLRMDSLLAGVYISYLYHFRIDYLKGIFFKHRLFLSVIAILGVCWVPFIEPLHSFFVKTIGFTLLYISFSILLISFLLIQDINQKLNTAFSAGAVNVISKIGYCSYSIYIIHTLVQSALYQVYAYLHLDVNYFLQFLIYFVCCIAAGMFMTYYLESFFLKIRDKYYPSRAAMEIAAQRNLK